jgi:phosphoglycerate dehydrogenase-like enzyme
MAQIPVVLVTEPEFRRGEPVFGSTTDLRCVAVKPDERSICDAIASQGARHVIVGSVLYGDSFYWALPRGGVIARFGVGHDTIDKTKATAAGLLCTNTPDVLQQSVAELTMLMIGAAARHLVPMANDMREGRWLLRQGTELQGKTLALVGCGAIGQVVARIAAAGYGMRVIGYRRTRATATGETPPEYFDSITDDFAAAVGQADFVSLHIPASARNQRFLDRDRLSMFPERAWLINTARGSVIDEAAMFDALKAGRLAGAALDVFEREPYQPSAEGRDLRTLPNVIMVPHVGSHTADANRRMAQRAVRNIRLANAGDTAAMDLLNREVLTV